MRGGKQNDDLDEWDADADITGIAARIQKQINACDILGKVNLISANVVRWLRLSLIDSLHPTPMAGNRVAAQSLWLKSNGGHITPHLDCCGACSQTN